VPIFYGARSNAGHSATYFHPGGGEFANVTVAWLDWQLKGNKKASEMFVGDKCGLCTNPNWETHSKKLSDVRPLSPSAAKLREPESCAPRARSRREC
jgi:hypothetical protein